DLHIEIRNALFVLGEPEQIPAHLQEAQGIALRIEDRPRQSRAGLLLSGWYWQRGQHAKALATSGEAIAFAAAEGDDVLTALGHYRHGVNHNALGQHPAAVEHLRRAVAILEQIGRLDLFAFGGHIAVFCAAFQSWSQAELGDFDDARQVGAEGWT